MARSWFYALLARYQEKDDAAFEPRSRRPKTSPNSVSPDAVELISRLQGAGRQGLDVGPHTIGWHLRHRHQVTVSAVTIS